MKNKELNEMTIEELKQQAKSGNTVTWLLVGILLILLCYVIYQSVRDGEMKIALVIPIACLPIVLINLRNLKKINSEIKSRNKL